MTGQQALCIQREYSVICQVLLKGFCVLQLTEEVKKKLDQVRYSVESSADHFFIKPHWSTESGGCV